MKITILIGILSLGLFTCQTSNNSTEKSIVNETLFTEIIHLDSLNHVIDSIPFIDSISICLPYPNDTFFELKSANFKTNDTLLLRYQDEIYWYLITNLDSLSPKNIIEKIIAYDTHEMIAKWDQHFTNDAHYIHHEGLEGGSTTYLYTHCKQKSEFFNTINSIILWQELDSTYHNPDMSWNKDSTVYGPIDGGAGCYYEIKKDSVENYMLEWYCGC